MNYIASDQMIKIPFGAWHGKNELELPFPDNWNVNVAKPYDAPEITDLQIKEAFSHPIESKMIKYLAEGKKTVSIAVEDITRPLPAYRLLPEIISELKSGGIDPENIQIIIGGAAHRPMSQLEMQKKLGEEIVDQFNPYMHDFMGPDVTYLGWVKGGPVYINRRFIEAELKICVGSVIPHAEVGFGGGAKMIIPGLAGRLSIAHFHGALTDRAAGRIETEKTYLDKRAWAEKVARFVNVDAVVCGVINSNGSLAGLFVGDLIRAHRIAAEKAAEIGKTVLPKNVAKDVDVVITNSFPLDTDPIQMGKTLSVANKIDHKLTIAINAASDGIFYHGMGMGSGLDMMRLIRNLPHLFFNRINIQSFLRSMLTGVRSPLTIAKLIYFSLNHLSYKSFKNQKEKKIINNRKPDDQRTMFLYSKKFPANGVKKKYPNAKLVTDWSEVTQQVNKRYKNPNVVVLPCAPIQLLNIEK